MVLCLDEACRFNFTEDRTYGSGWCAGSVKYTSRVVGISKIGVGGYIGSNTSQLIYKPKS